jgi:hypothetical protein
MSIALRNLESLIEGSFAVSHRVFPRLVACCLSLFVASFSFAADAADTPLPEPTSAPRTLETTVVTGAQPGLGLWKVSKGDHVLWILGSVSPLPKKMEWLSDNVEATIADSQAVLLAPTANITVKGGVFRGVFLLPAAMKARNNPDDALLKDVVPADLYERWLPLKQRYLGNDKGVEKRRPIFAALRLYERGVERSGLSFKDVVTPVVKKAARRHDVPVSRPDVQIVIDEPRDALRDFAKVSLTDIDCFRRTLDRIEDDIEKMRARGNAWAIGDVEALGDPSATEQFQACYDAIANAGVAQEHGLGDIRQRVTAVWMEAAEAALEKNRSTFAVLPLSLVLNPDGYVTRLRERGYTVEPPQP